jgi:hypothetical protein
MRVADHTGIVKSIKFKVYDDNDVVGEPYDRMKISVLNICRNTGSEYDDITGGDRKRAITNRWMKSPWNDQCF